MTVERRIQLVEGIRQFEQLLLGVAHEHGVQRATIRFEWPDLSVEDSLPSSIILRVQRQLASGAAKAEANLRADFFLTFGARSALWYGRVCMLLRNLEVDGID